MIQFFFISAGGSLPLSSNRAACRIGAHGVKDRDRHHASVDRDAVRLATRPERAIRSERELAGGDEVERSRRRQGRQDCWRR
jgi:hypothetical protein